MKAKNFAFTVSLLLDTHIETKKYWKGQTDMKIDANEVHICLTGEPVI